MKTLKENKDRIVVEIEYPEFYAYPEINRVVGAYITSDYEKTLENMKENHESIDWDDDFISWLGSTLILKENFYSSEFHKRPRPHTHTHMAKATSHPLEKGLHIATYINMSL